MKGFDYRQHRDLLLFILALVVLAFALFPKKSIFAAPEAVKIVFTQWWENDLEENTLRELISEFEDLHPGLKIVLEPTSYEELQHDLFAGTVPQSDVLALDPLWVPELQTREIIGSGSPPLVSFINVLYYNIDILKDSGFSRPPKTRTEFINYSRAVKKKDENYQALVMDDDSSRWVYDDVYPWIWASGVQLVLDGKPLVNSRPVIDSLAFLAALNSEDLVVLDKKLSHFCSGKTAFMISSARNIGLIRESMGEGSFGISSVPSIDNHAGPFFYGTDEWALGISLASARQEEAKLFVDFICEKASTLNTKSGASSAQRGDDPFYSKVWDIAISGEAARDFSALPWAEAEKAAKEALLMLFLGELSAAEAARSIQKEWEAIFDKNSHNYR